jgi:hypothetical protein
VTRSAAAAVVALALIVAGTVTVGARPTVVAAGARFPAPARGVIELGPGRHAAFTVDERVTIRGQQGATVEGGIVIRADGVRVEDVHVDGGETGILVRGARDVVLEGVSVSGADLHGIEVVEGTAAIRRCRIEGLLSPYAQGVEVRNSAGLGHSWVEGCSVIGGQEGVVSHVSRVWIRGNDVTATTQRAITVTEMSEGLVEGNVVHDVRGSGIFCGDMSHCEVRGNTITEVAPGRDGVRSEAGHAVTALYYATVRDSGTMTGALAGDPLHVAVGSVTTTRFPLGVWPAGWRGALSVVPATLVWMVLLGAVWLVVVAVTKRWSARAPSPRHGSMVVLAAAGMIQAFHQFEHSLQVWQVMVADAERRAGLLGSAVDTEWLHFGFNLALLVALVIGLKEVRVALPPVHRNRAGQWLAAAILVQGYHFAEHVVKLAQHLALGVDPAPGIVGHRFGLVAFHFAINVAVSVGLFTCMGIAWRAQRSDRRRSAALTPA